MNLLMSIGSWFGQNWMLLFLVVVAGLLIIPTFLKQKKEMASRNELHSSITKGVKIVTTAGVYGVVESVEETTDGKVVTIVTGNKKNPCTMTIHINAIMGIDNKTTSDTTKTVNEDAICAQESTCEHESIEDVEKQVYGKKTTKSKSSTTKKSSK